MLCRNTRLLKHQEINPSLTWHGVLAIFRLYLNQDKENMLPITRWKLPDTNLEAPISPDQGTGNKSYFITDIHQPGHNHTG